MHTLRKLPINRPNRAAKIASPMTPASAMMPKRPPVSGQGRLQHAVFGESLDDGLARRPPQLRINTAEGASDRLRLVGHEDPVHAVLNDFGDAANIAGNDSDAVGHPQQD